MDSSEIAEDIANGNRDDAYVAVCDSSEPTAKALRVVLALEESGWELRDALMSVLRLMERGA